MASCGSHVWPALPQSLQGRSERHRALAPSSRDSGSLEVKSRREDVQLRHPLPRFPSWVLEVTPNPVSAAYSELSRRLSRLLGKPWRRFDPFSSNFQVKQRLLHPQSLSTGAKCEALQDPPRPSVWHSKWIVFRVSLQSCLSLGGVYGN